MLACDQQKIFQVSLRDVFCSFSQLCGSFPDTMTKCAELLQNEVPIDFVDINIGCPIDLVFKQVEINFIRFVFI